MNCPSCNFDNKDGVAFCANCGTKMQSQDSEDKTVLINEAKPAEEAAPVTEAAPIEEAKLDAPVDDSESNTTVLTSELKGPGPVPVPGAPAPMNGAPMAFSPAPMGGPAPMNGAPMGGPAPMNGAPMGGPAPMNGVPAGKPGKAPKAPKAPKQPKAPKSGASVGTKVYIGFSIVAILALAGVLVYGIMQLNDKKDEIDKLNDDIASVTDAKDELASELEAEQAASETYVSTIDDLNSTVSTLESDNATLTSDLDYYTSYSSLIDFSNSQSASAEGEFFASHTVLHLTEDSTMVRVYFPVQGGTVYFGGNDSSIATCEWDENWINDSVATLYVTPVSSGYTTITLTNDQDSTEVKIYVYVD